MFLESSLIGVLILEKAITIDSSNCNILASFCCWLRYPVSWEPKVIGLIPFQAWGEPHDLPNLSRISEGREWLTPWLGLGGGHFSIPRDCFLSLCVILQTPSPYFHATCHPKSFSSALRLSHHGFCIKTHPHKPFVSPTDLAKVWERVRWHLHHRRKSPASGTVGVPLLNGFLPQSLVTLPVLAQEPTPLQFPQCFHAEEKEIGLDHYEITM